MKPTDRLDGLVYFRDEDYARVRRARLRRHARRQRFATVRELAIRLAIVVTTAGLVTGAGLVVLKAIEDFGR